METLIKKEAMNPLLKIGMIAEQSVIPTELIKEYYKRLGTYRGVYVIDMKQIIAIKLRKTGMTIKNIGELINVNHTSIVHLLNKRSPSIQSHYCEKYWFNWLIAGKYPVSIKVDNSYGEKTLSDIITLESLPQEYAKEKVKRIKSYKL